MKVNVMSSQEYHCVFVCVAALPLRRLLPCQTLRLGQQRQLVAVGGRACMFWQGEGHQPSLTRQCRRWPEGSAHAYAHAESPDGSC